MSDELKRKGAAQSKDIANYLVTSSFVFLFGSQTFLLFSLFCSQAQLSSSKERVEELEVALKESLNITAEREDVLVREEQRRQNLEKQVRANSDTRFVEFSISNSETLLVKANWSDLIRTEVTKWIWKRLAKIAQ